MSNEYDAEFIHQWRLELEREKLSIHPVYHKDLPTLPEQFDSTYLTAVLQMHQDIKKGIVNRFLMMLGL